jgi:tRNA threonylcarbamoyladenosine biosynthesis protein TsaB
VFEISIAADQQLAHLGPQAIGYMGDHGSPLPGHQTLVPAAGTATFATGQDKACNICHLSHVCSAYFTGLICNGWFFPLPGCVIIQVYHCSTGEARANNAMTGILAIDTATEACSVALFRDGDIVERHEITPRQHSQRLFGLLRELLPSGDLRKHGIEAIAYGCGPGSFTGLRIAASAVQGLAYANALPAIAISTLACQAQTALRLALVTPQDGVLSMLDARINEVYHASYRFELGLAVLCEGPVACAPADVRPWKGNRPLHAIGSGCRFIDELPVAVRSELASFDADLLPAAQDLSPLALDSLRRGETQSAYQVQPVYVRDEISWKKLSEQGKRV